MKHEVKIQTIDGIFIMISFILTPVVSDEGQIIHLVAEDQDITQRGSAEKELLLEKKKVEMLLIIIKNPPNR